MHCVIARKVIHATESGDSLPRIQYYKFFYDEVIDSFNYVHHF